MNSEIVTRNVITIDDDDMEYSTEDTIEVLNGGEFLDGLVRLYGAKHMQEVLIVEDDDDDSEDIEIFEKESDDIEIVEELINLGNPTSCQLFSVEEWRRYNQLASYYCEVNIDGIEEEIDTNETKTGEANTCVELVDLTSV